MRNLESWLLDVVSAVPELKPIHDGMVEFDGEAFLERAAWWARHQGVTPQVERLLGVLDDDYARRGTKIRGIIESSFVEPLADDPLAHHFGPHLRRAMRPHALRHRERFED